MLLRPDIDQKNQMSVNNVNNTNTNYNQNANSSTSSSFNSLLLKLNLNNIYTVEPLLIKLSETDEPRAPTHEESEVIIKRLFETYRQQKQQVFFVIQSFSMSIYICILLNKLDKQHESGAQRHDEHRELVQPGYDDDERCARESKQIQSIFY